MIELLVHLPNQTESKGIDLLKDFLNQASKQKIKVIAGHDLRCPRCESVLAELSGFAQVQSHSLEKIRTTIQSEQDEPSGFILAFVPSLWSDYLVPVVREAHTKKQKVMFVVYDNSDFASPIAFDFNAFLLMPNLPVYFPGSQEELGQALELERESASVVILPSSSPVRSLTVEHKCNIEHGAYLYSGNAHPDCTQIVACGRDLPIAASAAKNFSPNLSIVSFPCYYRTLLSNSKTALSKTIVGKNVVVLDSHSIAYWQSMIGGNPDVVRVRYPLATDCTTEEVDYFISLVTERISKAIESSDD